MPAFYFVPVGDPVSGIPVERYGDIWAGYFARKLIDHLDDRITFGPGLRSSPQCPSPTARSRAGILVDHPHRSAGGDASELVADSLQLRGRYVELADHLESADWPHKRWPARSSLLRQDGPRDAQSGWKPAASSKSGVRSHSFSPPRYCGFRDPTSASRVRYGVHRSIGPSPARNVAGRI